MRKGLWWPCAHSGNAATSRVGRKSCTNTAGIASPALRVLFPHPN